MNLIPSIPTDNLYKFQFIAGLAIIITSATILVTQISEIEDSINSLQLIIVKDKAEAKFLSEDTSDLQREIDSLKTINNNNKQNTRKNEVEYISKHENEIQSLINRKTVDLKQKRRKLDVRSEIDTVLLSQIEAKYRNLIILLILTLIFIVEGLRRTISGYNNWYNLVQKPLDKKLQLEIDQLDREIKKK